MKLERLETRRVLATFTVTDMSDDGPGTLRRAVLQANTQPGPDEIVFDDGLSNTSINLTSGEIVISDAVSIQGQSPSKTSITVVDNTTDPRDGSAGRIFRIDDGNASSDLDVSLSFFSLHGGDADGNGGAILNTESLTLDTVSFSNTYATQDGGAIHSSGPIQTNMVRIAFAEAGRHGGAISVQDAPFQIGNSGVDFSNAIGLGGGFYSDNTPSSSFTDFVVSGNSAEQGGGAYIDGNVTAVRFNSVFNEAGDSGGGLYVSGNNVQVTDSNISRNEAAMNGGGVFAEGIMEIANSFIQDNEAQQDGGGIYASFPVTLVDSSVERNEAMGDGGGFFSRARISIDGTLFDSNESNENGGGIYLSANRLQQIQLISNSTISNNESSGDGGGFYASYLVTIGEFSNITVNGNHAGGDGGGMALTNGGFSGRFDLHQLTVAGNTANGSGGGLAVGGNEVGIALNLSHSTVAENNADHDDDGNGQGGGLAQIQNMTPAISHSVFSKNRQAEIASDWVGGFMKDRAEYSLFETQIDAGTTNLIVEDAMLGPLQDNGGPTHTMFPLEGSPAIDAGDPLLMPVGFDQRGEPFLRVRDGDEDGQAAIDIGAVEVDGNGPPTADAGSDFEVRTGEVAQLDGSQSFDPEGDSLTFLWSIVGGPGTATIVDETLAITDFSADTVGEYVVMLTVDDGSNSASDTLTITVVDNQIPIADASLSDRTGEIGKSVILSGVGSFDPEGGVIGYDWSFISLPEGSVAELMPVINVVDSVFFIPDVAGEYVAELVVNDGLDESLPVQVTVLVAAENNTFHNTAQPTDVDESGATAPLDALLVINELNDPIYSDPETGEIAFENRPNDAPFLDVNDDGFISPIDALLVINALDDESPAADFTRGDVEDRISFALPTVADVNRSDRRRGAVIIDSVIIDLVLRTEE